MKPDRLNAFTDGVLAVVITIMVLELKFPDEASWAAVRAVLPILAIYALSFVNIGIYWNNHHHMMQSVRRIDGRVLWANLFLLFWLSLFPLLIRWIGEVGVTPMPVAAFGLVLVLAAFAYLVLERALIAAEGEESKIAKAVGSKNKEWLSLALYLLGAALAFTEPWVSVALYVAVAIVWFVPDRRFEEQS
jgi:uncharacterized membrane protein